jgi:ACT domain-containing protein
MEILVTLDVVRHRGEEKVLHYPPDTLVTKEAKAYAAKQGIEIYVGDEKLPKPSSENGKPGLKAVISVIGEDKVGIIAGISAVLAEAGVNILDITQTAIEGLFTMIMIVDISRALVSFEELKQRLSAKGTEMSVRVDAQREEVFHFMHRI